MKKLSLIFILLFIGCNGSSSAPSFTEADLGQQHYRGTGIQKSYLVVDEDGRTDDRGTPMSEEAMLDWNKATATPYLFLTTDEGQASTIRITTIETFGLADYRDASGETTITYGPGPHETCVIGILAEDSPQRQYPVTWSDFAGQLGHCLGFADSEDSNSVMFGSPMDCAEFSPDLIDLFNKERVQ